jgi:hypothetical protein
MQHTTLYSMFFDTLSLEMRLTIFFLQKFLTQALKICDGTSENRIFSAPVSASVRRPLPSPLRFPPKQSLQFPPVSLDVVLT